MQYQFIQDYNQGIIQEIKQWEKELDISTQTEWKEIIILYFPIYWKEKRKPYTLYGKTEFPGDFGDWQ